MSLDVYLKVVKPTEVYSANITHNLGDMADAAGIYKELWRPEEISIGQARQLIEPLKAAIARLNSDPDKFRRLNPENGWGSYVGFLKFCEEYLKACEENPDASVEVSR
jgi:hypothetical protein